MQLHTQKVTMRQRMRLLLLSRTLKKRTPQKHMPLRRTPQRHTPMKRTPQKPWLPTMLLKDTRLWGTKLRVMELQATMATVPHTT